MDVEIEQKPRILAPAGNRAAFLAGIDAGADAIYCGLKHFSARMESKNFTIEELTGLAKLARKRDIKVYVAFNSLIKSEELTSAGQLLVQLNRYVHPAAIIVQDPALIELAKQTGFKGEIHLSTLANVGLPKSLSVIKKTTDVRCIVLPRELTIDEIKSMAAACPEGLDLEVFIHGALCYGVSGRCYWSSYLGGKSGLRGRCVQPCRRIYTQGKHAGRLFSCQDFSVDALVKLLLSIDKIRSWKIEGRKKGPHYVYYTVSAYRILRDESHDAGMKKTALKLLERSLGRPGTHYYFLPQHKKVPVASDVQTGSGMFIGKINSKKTPPSLAPREELLPDDVLRIGYEDEPWHYIHKVNRFVPRSGRLEIPQLSKKIKKDVPVFLTDRKEGHLEDALDKLAKEMDAFKPKPIQSSNFRFFPKEKFVKSSTASDITITRSLPRGKAGRNAGVWLSDTVGATGSDFSGVWLWLPPVVWPETEDNWQRLVENAIQRKANKFVLNSVAQIALFQSGKTRNKKIQLWAGPFCNFANTAAIETAKALGFFGCIVSPELSGKDYLDLPAACPVPLGIVVFGNFPLCISRTKGETVKTGVVFESPKGECAWISEYDGNYWVYPNWRIDIREHKDALRKAGYRQFIYLYEPIPKTVTLKKRPGLWNWNIGLA